MRPGAEGGLLFESGDEIYHAFQAVDNFEFDLAPDGISPEDVSNLKSVLADTPERRLEIGPKYSTVALVALELYTGSGGKYRFETGEMLNDYARKRLQDMQSQA